jgi:hypothetical protein
VISGQHEKEFFELLNNSEALGAQAAVLRVAEMLRDLGQRATREQMAAEALRGEVRSLHSQLVALEGELDREAPELRETDGLMLEEVVCVGEDVTEAVVDTELVAVGLALPLADAEADADLVGLAELDGELLGEAVPEVEPVEVLDDLGECEADSEACDDALSVAEGELEAEDEADDDMVGEGLDVELGEAEVECDGDEVADGEKELLGVGLGEEVDEAVTDRDAVAVVLMDTDAETE